MRAPLTEGVLFEHRSGIIFHVKGCVHPKGAVVAFPRYLPLDARGRRFRKLKTLEEQMRVAELLGLVRFVPEIGRRVPVVPTDEITRILDPIERAREILEGPRDLHERRAAGFIEELLRWGVPEDAVGVSGSLLARLHGPGSDIDIVVYGEEACHAAYRALKAMREEGITRPLEGAWLERCMSAWLAETPFPQWMIRGLQPRRIVEGVFRGHAYFARLVPHPRIRSGRVIRLSRVVALVVVEDDGRSMMMPCVYGARVLARVMGEVEPGEVIEILSLRGRFCEIVKRSEIAKVVGTLELHDEDHKKVIYVGDAGDLLLPVLRSGAT